MLAFGVAAAIWQRRQAGGVARIDFSMIEAMLWTMAEPLLAAQTGEPPRPMGNASDRHCPHGAWHCAGEDAWLALAVTDEAQWQSLCELVPALSGSRSLGLSERMEKRGTIEAALAQWLAPQSAAAAAATLRQAGVPAAALASASDLVADPHLRAREFWTTRDAGMVPGLPWRASFGRVTGPAPALGADTEAVLRAVLGLAPTEIAALRASGALG